MINPKNIILTLFCYLMFFAPACEEKTDWDLQTGDNGKLVIEAIFTNELLYQKVKLSETYPSLNGEAPPISNASVQVSANGQSIMFLPDNDKPGLYKSKIPFSIINDLTYTLKVEWNGKNYSATSELSNVAPMPKITFKQFGNTDSLLLNTFAPLYNANQQAMYELRVDWSHLNTNNNITHAKLLFYTFSTTNVGILVPPPHEIVYIPRGSIVLAKKFGLNDDFAEYLRALVIETDWNGGAFYEPSANLPSNFSNEGIGFFSTCAVVKDTLIAK